MSDKKVIGILGGMGPLATADLFQKITLHTAASAIRTIRACIDSNTNISDRTAALLHGGADPVPEMVKSAQRPSPSARIFSSCPATPRTTFMTPSPRPSPSPFCT